MYFSTLHVSKSRSLASLEVHESLRNITNFKSAKFAQRWIELVLNEKFDGDFAYVLKDGIVLFAFIKTVLSALCIPTQMTLDPSEAFSISHSDRSHKTLSSQKQCHLEPHNTKNRNVSLRQEARTIMLQHDTVRQDAFQRIAYYNKCCLRLGMTVKDCFETEDLYEHRNMIKVYRNIVQLQTCAIALSNRLVLEEKLVLEKENRVIQESEEEFAMKTMSVRHWEAILSDYEIKQKEWSRASLQYGKAASLSEMENVEVFAHRLHVVENEIRHCVLRGDGMDASIPDVLHGKLWLLSSGAAREMEARREYYRELSQMQPVGTEAVRQIDADLHRTISPAGGLAWTEMRTAMMRRILIAYSMHNPKLGYCQGLNFIVARLLQFVSEEEAFFLLIKMIQLLPEDYYTTMLGLAIDQHVFTDFVHMQYPEIVDRLATLGGSGVELSLACTEWFLTLFASPCKKALTARVWDSLFFAGDKILFQLSLALLDQSKQALSECDTYGGMLNVLNGLGRNSIDVTKLLRCSKSYICVRRARMEHLRAHHRLHLASGIAISSMDEEDLENEPRIKSNNSSDAKHRIFGRKKQTIMKTLERSSLLPNRSARTFDREISQEYIAAIQIKHAALYQASYYDPDKALYIQDAYWGSETHQSQWKARTIKKLSVIQANSTCPPVPPNDSILCLGELVSTSTAQTALSPLKRSIHSDIGFTSNVSISNYAPQSQSQRSSSLSRKDRLQHKGWRHKLWHKDLRHSKSQKTRTWLGHKLCNRDISPSDPSSTASDKAPAVPTCISLRSCSFQDSECAHDTSQYPFRSASDTHLDNSAALHVDTTSPTITSGASDVMEVLPCARVMHVKNRLPHGISALPRTNEQNSDSPIRYKTDQLENRRDRAHVMAFLHRKASDASVPRASPSEGLSRCSESSGFSPSTEHVRTSYAGSHTSKAVATPYSRGSFSFFDRLSLDIENFSD